MKEDITITLENNKKIKTFSGITASDLLKKVDKDNEVIALRIDGEIVPSTYEINDDATVEYIRVSDRIGIKIYIKGLEYVYICAVKALLGDKTEVRIKHSLDKAIYTQINTKKKLNVEIIKEIKKKMNEIIKEDHPFHRINSTRKDTIEYVKSLEEYEKELNYTYMTNDYVTLYELLDNYNYFYYLMPASTVILKKFDLTFIQPNGVVLSYPIGDVVPKYNPSPKVLDAFSSCEEKYKKIGVSYAGDINKLVCDGKINDFILANELMFDEGLDQVVEKVNKNRNIRTILISGPSSSGKTTTSKKICLGLRAKGIKSFVISTDDYFVERVDTPKKPNGQYEYEIVDALDIKLFDTQMSELLKGNEVIIPTYNFITGEKDYKRKPVKIDKDTVLIVEGLHAINERLTSRIETKNKLKIYISPFTPLSIDRHNPISTTDIRLLRRMVRDYMTRGYSAEDTLNRWMDMRSSEENYIYPYQREANIVVNTSLAYEIGVIRTYVEPLLYSIERDSAVYEEAGRILDFLKGFINIPSDRIPQTSVLREFIGNSYFE